MAILNNQRVAISLSIALSESHRLKASQRSSQPPRIAMESTIFNR